jgi:hypothetical protein
MARVMEMEVAATGLSAVVGMAMEVGASGVSAVMGMAMEVGASGRSSVMGMAMEVAASGRSSVMGWRWRWQQVDYLSTLGNFTPGILLQSNLLLAQDNHEIH